MSEETVLVVEDEDNIRKFIHINLARNGFKVVDAALGKEGLKLFEELNPEVVILDLMLPDMDGYEICRKIREISQETVVVMLTAKGQDMDKIIGIELGADDYMVKPFNPLELVVRIRKTLRRVHPKEAHKDLRFNIDLSLRKIIKDGEPLQLSPKEYALMKILMTQQHKTLSRDELLDAVWGEDYYGDYKTVDVHVRRLREKIEDTPSEPKFIETVWGYGYRWRGDL